MSDEGIAVVSVTASSVTNSLPSRSVRLASWATYPSGWLGSTMTGLVGFITVNWIQAISSL
jgi:hypothetical protein